MESRMPRRPVAGDFSDGVARGYPRGTSEEFPISRRVSPGAKKTGVKGMYGERAVKLLVAAPLAKGHANAGAERFPAWAPKVAASRVEVIRGGSGRGKTVLARGASGERVSRALDVPPGE